MANDNYTLLTPDTLAIGSSATFRSTLNGNFEKLQTNATGMNDAVNTLRSDLKTVAFTGNASDLTEDDTHKLVTAAEKESWGKKMIIQTEEEPASTQYHIFQDGDDVTSEMQTLFSSGSWKPTKTSDLQNDSFLIQGSDITSSTIIYLEDVRTVKVADSSPIESGSEFTVKWKVPCADSTHACTSSMIPVAVLSQEDSMGGDWAQVCESGDGVVYLWSKASTTTHTVNPITLKSISAYMPVELNRVPILCFTANTAGSTISMSVTGTPTLSQNFKYSYTGTDSWMTFIPGETTITLSDVGDWVYFKGNNVNGVNESSTCYYKFVMTGSIAASGNIMSLVDDGACTTLTIPNNYCFYRMFYNCSALTSAPSLPATTLKDSCYENLFYTCWSLASAPSLPATTLAAYCYRGMFGGCVLFTTAPTLPATTLTERCYYQMFSSCTALTAPPSLPATTLAKGCYEQMFAGCRALATAPVLPATIMAEDCYADMFYDCRALRTAPALPATTLATGCYGSMFLDCSSLTTPPALPATTLASWCYGAMFNYCESLQVNDSPVTGVAEQAWTIPASGTFTNTYKQSYMFTECPGTRASDDMAGETGQSYTYYIQNTPVS